MLSFMDYKRMSLPAAAGLRRNSDALLEAAWSADPATHLCYLYDCAHDDQPELNSGMTYSNTTKQPAEAKFFTRRFHHAGRRCTEYEIRLRPSQTVPAYYEKSFGPKAVFPAGLYLDIPDERGTYRRWLICDRRQETGYTAFTILPCNYEFLWISGPERCRLWGFSQLKNRYFPMAQGEGQTGPENREQIWLPRTASSALLFYNQRLIVSDLRPEPLIWEITDIENIHPTGILKLTLSPVPFHAATDYIDPETGDMWADYRSASAPPLAAQEPELDPPFTLTCACKSIKIGGSSRTVHLRPRSNASLNAGPDNLSGSSSITLSHHEPVSGILSGFSSTDLGSSDFSSTDLGSSGFGSTDLGSSGFGSTGFGSSGFGSSGSPNTLPDAIIWRFTVDGQDISAKLEISPQDNTSVKLRVPQDQYLLTDSLLTIQASNIPSYPLTLKITAL